MALLGRDTVEHAVDHRGGLGTGDVALGAERAVGIARDPAVARGELDIRLRPVARDVREAALALVELGEQRDDLCHLRARDGRVGAERAVGIAVHDAGLRHGGNRGVIPRIRRHVGISVGLGQVRAAALLRQQAEEDGRRLGAGDLAVRLHRAVGITDDVGEVVVRVQTESILIGDLNGVVRLGGVMTSVALPLCNVGHVCRHGFSNRRRPTHKRIAAASGGIAIKARRGTALCDFIDLILENFFVINTVGVGHGKHLSMRGFEGNRLTIIRYRLILISRINCPAANLLIATFAIVCSRIPLIPSIMIPTGNVFTIRGKFLITGHLGCNR